MSSGIFSWFVVKKTNSNLLLSELFQFFLMTASNRKRDIYLINISTLISKKLYEEMNNSPDQWKFGPHYVKTKEVYSKVHRV